MERQTGQNSNKRAGGHTRVSVWPPARLLSLSAVSASDAAAEPAPGVASSLRCGSGPR